MTSANRWLVRPRPNPQAVVKLICFPYAGGGASTFSSWAGLLPTSIELCAVLSPGRESRLAEPAFVMLEPYLEALASAIEPEIDRSVAFFGHSLGALIAFELIRLLRSRGRCTPIHLFASGHGGPSVDSADRALHTLSDAELLEELKRLDGTPPALLENHELMELMLPTVRADLTLSEQYRYVSAAPLQCPITALGGEDDVSVRPEDMASWKKETTEAFNLRLFPGNHFFLNVARDAILRSVAGELLCFSGGQQPKRGE